MNEISDKEIDFVFKISEDIIEYIQSKYQPNHTGFIITALVDVSVRLMQNAPGINNPIAGFDKFVEFVTVMRDAEIGKLNNDMKKRKNMI